MIESHQNLGMSKQKITELPHPSGEVRLLHIIPPIKRFESIEIQKSGITLSKVFLNNYSSWEYAFDAAMDKAGF